MIEMEFLIHLIKSYFTYEDVIVDEDGVTMTDDDFLLAYKMYKDSTGEYSVGHYCK